MTPSEASFDGAKGVKMNLPGLTDGGRYHLRRGKKNPSKYPNTNFREQLLWHYPDDAPARLLWCNAADQNKMLRSSYQTTPRTTMKTLYEKLLTAEVVCRDCGSRYGKYSVGCSSCWEGTCDVCEKENVPVTEVRDCGYLTRGIHELKAQRPAEPFSELTKDFTPERKAKIKEQSAKVADYMLSVGPIMDDNVLEETLSKTKYRSSVTRISVHREDAEHRTLQTEVTLEDEGAGEFISLTDTDGNEIRLDFEEFEEVVKAVKTLRNQPKQGRIPEEENDRRFKECMRMINNLKPGEIEDLMGAEFMEEFRGVSR
jgi:hypothetical protein